MSLVLNTNLNSLNAQNSLTASGSKLSTALQQLSSGLRINTAADDAAGYAIVQGMNSQISGLNVAARNAADGVSLTQTASGALSEIVSDLQTMRDLAVQSLNATNSSQDRANLDQQFQQLKADITNVAQTTAFNGVNLLDGSFQGATFQIGANTGESISVASVASAAATQIGTYYTGQLSIVSNVTNSSGTTTAALAGVAGVYNATTLAGATALNTVVNGSAVTLGVTVDGTAYSTGPIALTGTAATDLKSVAAGINQAISSVGGLVATVNAAGTGITISGTTPAGTGHVVATAVTSATDAGGNAVTLTAAQKTATLTNLGVDSSDTVGTYAVGAVVTNPTAGQTAYLGSLNVKSVDNSNLVLIAIDNALQQVSASGAQLGAYQNRFQAAITGINTTATNLTAARSQIEDTNFAQATSDLSKAQILQQAGTAMVAQANTVPQNVLTLLQKLP